MANSVEVMGPAPAMALIKSQFVADHDSARVHRSAHIHDGLSHEGIQFCGIESRSSSSSSCHTDLLVGRALGKAASYRAKNASVNTFTLARSLSDAKSQMPFAGLQTRPMNMDCHVNTDCHVERTNQVVPKDSARKPIVPEGR